METISYRTSGVCSRQIDFAIENGILHDVKFYGGCNGNTKAISKLLEGADAVKTVQILKGNLCGARGTSCADQLAIAIEKALNKEN